ncbi:MAG: TolC family protein [Pyrinomonadaceae bacterium]
MKPISSALAACLFAGIISGTGAAQQPSMVDPRASSTEVASRASTATVSATVARFYDPQTGASSTDIVRRALASNGDLLAARLDIGRARARLRQAALRPNPTLDVEQSTGRLVGSPGESETSVGVSLPLELGGKRGRRIDLARAELEATETEVADRERRLAGEVLALYAEALTALRELQITEGLSDIDLQTARYVQARVNEGEAAPLELSLLQVEVDRMRSRRALVEGRLEAALLRLKGLASIPANEPLRLREQITAPLLREPPGSVESAVEIALRTRPDIRLARLTEEVAQAGLRLANAQGAPEVSAVTRFSVNQSSFDNTPVGPLRDRDRTLTFGVSVGIPVFNKNQGGREEAAIAITQARTRRAFLEQTVRAEVMSAYARYESTRKALATFEQGVIERSDANIRSIRAAYQLGEFRITDLLAEQRRLLDAQREFSDTLAERYRALADLQQAIGAPINSQER